MNELMPIEDARAQVLAAISSALPPETVALADALGRVLAADVAAATDLPPWDNSAMDGYAIRAADVADASESGPALLRVTGEVAAGGAVMAAVEPGTAVRIATGAPMPPGADAVVAVEQTTPLAADGTAGPRGREATGPSHQAAPRPDARATSPEDRVSGSLPMCRCGGANRRAPRVLRHYNGQAIVRSIVRQTP